MTVSTGLPFTIILLAMCYSVYKGLNEESKKKFIAHSLETFNLTCPYYSPNNFCQIGIFFKLCPSKAKAGFKKITKLRPLH